MKDHREIVQYVDQFKRKVHDLIDDANHPYSRELQRAIDELIKDVKVKRHSINVHQRIFDVSRSLQQIRNHGDQIMDFRHTDMFMKQCQELNGIIDEYYPY